MLEKIIPTLLSLLPAVLWGSYFLKKRDDNFKTYLGVFIFACITVGITLGYQILYQNIIYEYPNLDFIYPIKDFITNKSQFLWVATTVAWFASSEEVIKFLITYIVDKKNPELICTIQDAAKFGLLTGLAFSFGENLVYFFRFHNFQELGMRSLITMCGHLVWSSFIAYFYGISKFSKDINIFRKYTGHNITAKTIANFRKNRIIIGILASSVIHTTYNLMYQIPLKNNLNTLIAYFIIFIGFIVLNVIMDQKYGKLKFIITDKYKGNLDNKIIETIYEYMGYNYMKQKYDVVFQTASRLLKREPDNNVAKIFQAKSYDKIQAQAKDIKNAEHQ